MFYSSSSNTQDSPPLSWYVCAMCIGCIIWGSITASFYTKQQNIRYSHTNTACLLLEYTAKEHRCVQCGFGCIEYKCFDETLQLSYPIANGSYINSTFNSYNRGSQREQQQIGQNYTCFYNLNEVTSVVFDLPDTKSNLIQFIVAFSIVGVILLISMIYLYRKLKKK